MKKNIFLKALFTSFVILIMTGCSDDKSTENKMQTNGVENTPISHSLLDSKVSASDKQKFK
jgi:uncharacterized lipoprotein YajG